MIDEASAHERLIQHSLHAMQSCMNMCPCIAVAGEMRNSSSTQHAQIAMSN